MGRRLVAKSTILREPIQMSVRRSFRKYLKVVQRSRVSFQNNLEARGGIEPPIKVLQTFALPLGYRALEQF
jgi:hypothetical protein